MLAIGMISMALGILIGRFVKLEYSGFSVSDFVEGVLVGLSLVMNLVYLIRTAKKQRNNQFCQISDYNSKFLRHKTFLLVQYRLVFECGQLADNANYIFRHLNCSRLISLHRRKLNNSKQNFRKRSTLRTIQGNNGNFSDNCSHPSSGISNLSTKISTLLLDLAPLFS